MCDTFSVDFLSKAFDGYFAFWQSARSWPSLDRMMGLGVLQWLCFTCNYWINWRIPRSKTNYFCFSQAMFTHLSPHRSFRGICEICHRRVWFYNGISPINFFDIKCIERNFELRVGSFVPSRLEKKNYYQKQNRSSKLFILWRNL